MDFIDRVLKCSDCSSDFTFTAGEQLFFSDRQFKNDPKRCKLCKAKRAGLGRSAEGVAVEAALPLSRTETRTECSACGIDTTVPFKPTQGRPVFCRSCFQLKRVPAAVAKAASLDTPALAVEQAMELAMEQAVAQAVSGSSSGISQPLSAVEAIAEAPHAALSGDRDTQIYQLMAAEAATA